MNLQRGNALFLILIAVALFAALSYAVTQSGRSSGTIDRETAAIAAAQITDFGTSVHTAAMRMILMGTPAYSLCYGANGLSCEVPALNIFDPTGGNVIYQCPTDAQVVDSDPLAADWRFRGIHHTDNNGLYIQDVGTNTDVTGREALAYLRNVRLSVCWQINKKLGLAGTPADNSGFIPSAGGPTYGAGGNNVIYAYPGHAYGCVDSGGPDGYAYYHAVVEQ